MNLARCFRVALSAAAAGVFVSLMYPAEARAEEQIVYWPLVSDGTEYRRVAYPKEAGPLLVLADTEVVLEARRADVRYWPITREYLAGLSKDSPAVEGSIEIVDASGEVAVVESTTSYLLWYPEGVGVGPVELVHGPRAPRFYDGYVRTARAAAEAAKQYQRLVAERRAALEAWLRIAAERPAKLPPPPPELDIPEPEAFRAFASEPRHAAVINLPEGTYTLRIRGSDGGIVEGSERDLVSFAPLDQAVGYVLRPENRWTRPTVSFAPEETIYTTGETDLYLQPVPIVEYEAHRFTRLFRPQSVETVDQSLTIWTPRADRGNAAGTALAVSNGSSSRAVPLTSYRVAQLPGVSRGYVIKKFDPAAEASLEPDFHAMRVRPDAPATRISLLAGTDTVPASERQLKRVTIPADILLFLPSLVPLAVGVAVRLRMRRAV